MAASSDGLFVWDLLFSIYLFGDAVTVTREKVVENSCPSQPKKEGDLLTYPPIFITSISYNKYY